MRLRPICLRVFNVECRIKRQYRPKGKLQEDFESKRKPCKFFLTEAGCKRGRACTFGHLLDGEKRCWNCGSRGHVATSCTVVEDVKPRAAKMKPKSEEKDSRKGQQPEKTESPDLQEPNGDDSMKILIEEANKMLQSLQQSEPKEKTISPKVHTEKMDQLQRQLDELKKASLRPFRISRIGCTKMNGLIDSGATHPLRVSELVGLVKVLVIFHKFKFLWQVIGR